MPLDQRLAFYKYHALGNDYIVMDPTEAGRELSTDEVVRICHRNFGVGSDGILWGPGKMVKDEPFALKIYNPDGSVAEKSGNGLRIFSRYLWDNGLVGEDPFEVQTDGGIVTSQLHDGGRSATVAMGKVEIRAVEEEIEVGGETLKFCEASVGNPHCVVMREGASEEEARRLGPLLEIHPRFPNRTNVQFVEVLDRNTIRIEIWERGAGYTLASGSSSSAAAAVVHKLGHCGREIAVRMPGGEIAIVIGEDSSISMTGGVTRVAEGVVFREAFA
ncbi:diaminopimelate epimerase [soil metagenome]